VSRRLSIFVCIVAALALTGCGRRGPLEPPPGSPPDAKPNQQVTPRTQAQNAPGGLFRNTTLKPEEAETKPDEKPKRSSSFILDPLL